MLSIITIQVIAIQVHAKLQKKLVHFYMLITLKHKKVVEKFMKNTHLLNEHML